MRPEETCCRSNSCEIPTIKTGANNSQRVVNMATEWKSKRETKSLLTVQNKAIRINYIKTNVHNTQQNTKCNLRDEKDETISHIIRKCKLQPKNTPNTYARHMGTLDC